MRSVLIIEDDDLVRKSLRILLSRAGFDVKEASSGPESIELFTKAKYDLVVTDLLMPKMSGAQVIKKLR